MRDCQPGHGTVFQFQKYLPYNTLAAVLVSAALLHYGGLITIRRGLVLGLLFLLFLVCGLVGGFLMVIPYFNCVLMRDHRVIEQPFVSTNLTQRMTHEAVGFIERYVIHVDQQTHSVWVKLFFFKTALPGSAGTRRGHSCSILLSFKCTQPCLHRRLSGEQVVTVSTETLSMR